MNILFCSPNYAPEPTGIPPLVTDAAEWLCERGHRVDVVTALPNYPERRIHDAYRGMLFSRELRNGVHVHRSWLLARREASLRDKAAYELTLSAFALPNMARLAPKADLVLCVVPTLLGALNAAIVSRMLRKRMILWVQDLVLNAALAMTGRNAQPALDSVRRLERWIFRAASEVIVCSPGFVDYVTKAGVDGSRVHTVLNWADTEWITEEQFPTAVPPRFLYAGNLGHTQGLQSLLDAAAIAGRAVSVHIAGDGNAATEVRRAARGLGNVSVGGPVPRDAYPALLASADAHLVVQRRIAAGANLPSKIATSLASGRPLVAAISEDTPAAALLRESGGAMLVEPESPQALADAMLLLAGDRRLRVELGHRARVFAENHLSKAAALARLAEIVVP